MKQLGPLMGLELTTDRYPPITSQTRFLGFCGSWVNNQLKSPLTSTYCSYWTVNPNKWDYIIIRDFWSMPMQICTLDADVNTG